MLRTLILVALVAAASWPLRAQWYQYPSPGAPRTGTGQVDLAGATPKDPNPSWQGYSSATWSGDTLVIDTIGFRDDLWIDWDGSVITEAAKLREQIRRPDFGHLEIEVTVDDPKAYTKPWTVTLRQQFAADAELVDEICAENEKDSQRLK
jgi:hypothetical protein